MGSFSPSWVLVMTLRDNGGDGALRTIEDCDANVVLGCISEVKWLIANLVRPMGKERELEVVNSRRLLRT